EQHEQRDQRTSEVIGRPFHFLELLLLISVITFCIPLGRFGAGARFFNSSQASLELVCPFPSPSPAPIRSHHRRQTDGNEVPLLVITSRRSVQVSISVLR